MALRKNKRMVQRKRKVAVVEEVRVKRKRKVKAQGKRENKKSPVMLKALVILKDPVDQKADKYILCRKKQHNDASVKGFN